MQAHILKQLPQNLPSTSYDGPGWPHTARLNLTDPDYGQPRGIDLLLGTDYYGQIIKPNIIRGLPTQPIAQLSIFGWLLLGPVDKTQSTLNTSLHISKVPSLNENQDHLNALLTNFWELEEVPAASNTAMDPGDAFCETHFQETHSRDVSGNYIVRLPLNSSPEALGDLLSMARSCFKRTMLKLKTNEKLNASYMAFMQEYAQLGHMKPIPEDQLNNRPAFYLPHHGVLKMDNLMTKLRVVFNGSAKSTSGVSLNDIMHAGPNLLLNIMDVITWLRHFKFAFSTDISKMYRRFGVHPADWDLQRIVWVDDQLKETRYQLTTVTYRTKAVPFLATRALLQLAQDEGTSYPLAVEPIVKGRYFDDILGSADNQETLILIAQQLKQLCMAGGLLLAKWRANNASVLNSITTDDDGSSVVSLNDCNAKILRLQWNTQQDKLSFTLNLPLTEGTFTKRKILSEVSQIFNPIGIISPVIIQAKILLQELWLLKLNWDEPVPHSIETKWKLIREDFTNLSAISLPRWLGTSENIRIKLHGFCDASQFAMGAVLYVKFISRTSDKVSWLCSKTKVAPLKKVSIPRLELTAACLLAKLAKHFLSSLRCHVETVNLWTDFQVTLAWVISHPSRWKEFVQNRVSLIQELVPIAKWRHVSSSSNPADCASRGMTTTQLLNHDLWWHGPSWLHQPEDSWPTLKTDMIDVHDLPGARPVHSMTVSTQHNVSWELLYRYSSLTKLLRITTLCQLVFSRDKPPRNSSQTQLLIADKLTQAKLFWIKATQRIFFAQEIKLIDKDMVPASHPFNRLTAYLDADGII